MIIGPYLACRPGRMDSSYGNDFRSHGRFSMNGTTIGPRGSILINATDRESSTSFTGGIFGCTCKKVGVLL